MDFLLSFAAHWRSQTTLHISTDAGRIKFSAIVCDDLVRAPFNPNKYDALNNFSFERRDFVEPSFCFKYSFRFLSKKDCGLLETQDVHSPNVVSFWMVP